MFFTGSEVVHSVSFLVHKDSCVHAHVVKDGEDIITSIPGSV